MKTQSNTLAYSAPVTNFGFLAELFAAMPIVVFFKAIRQAAQR